MGDTAVANSTQSSVSELTEQEAKELHKKLNQFYRKRRGQKKKNKPVIKPRGKVITKQITIAIEESSTNFDEIEDEPFSLDTNASQLFVKVEKERMKCVNTGKSFPVGGAAVYRVFL